MTLQEWLAKNMGRYQQTRLRLGQRFVIECDIKHWPELFYESHEGLATTMIRIWCNQMCYTDNLPIKKEIA